MSDITVTAVAAERIYRSFAALSAVLAACACLYGATAHAGHADTLDLDELVAEALQANPSITAAEKMSEAASERVSQVGTLDDPMLTLGVANVETEYFAFDRIPMTSKNIGLSQRFPFFGKLDLKESAAGHEAEATAEMVGENRLAVAYRVKDAYYELCLVLRELEVLDRQTALVRLIGQTARARYSVGKGTLGDSLKAEVEEARLMEMRETLLRRERTVRAMLGNLTGRGAAVEGEPVWPGRTCDPPGRDSLVAMAVENRPGIAAADARIEKGRDMVELAELGYWPDMGVSFTYHQLDDLRSGVQQSDRFTAMLSFNLPVWRGSRLDPAVREAASMKASSESARDSLVNDIAYAVDSLLSDVKRENELIKLYDGALTPLAKKELEAEMDRYSVGEMDLSDLLGTARETYDYELGSYRARIRREKAVAGIEAAVGVSSDAWCPDTEKDTENE